LKNNVDKHRNDKVMTQFYLDYNASAPLRPLAREAVLTVLSQTGALNASALHTHGRAGRKIIETAREALANLVGTQSTQIIFNSGATEGNNTIIRFFEQHYPDESILVGATEHPSILETSKKLEYIPVNADGLVNMRALEARLQQSPKISLVSIMAVNNESGVIQNIGEISALAHRYGALFHTDAVQAAGRIPINMQETGIDFLTLSSHKIGGPQGVGALALGSCGITPVLFMGGGQEKSARAGTENVAGIAGFGAAARESLEHLTHYQALSGWRDDMEASLLAISPDIIIHGQNAPRVANTTFFSLSDKDSQSLLIAFDLEGIALSNGSACSSGTVKPSHVLLAMGTDKKRAAGALRISTGWATKKEDINAFLNAWEKIYNRIRK
jgi:cysteine desulfurase